MLGLTLIDYIAIGWFFVAWFGYTALVDYSPLRRHSVSAPWGDRRGARTLTR